MKIELRKKYLSLRKKTINKDSKNKLIVERINNLIKDKDNILIYYPIQNEPNILDLVNLNKDKTFYLPYCIDNQDMEARLIEGLDKLIKDKKNIYSSSGRKGEVDVVIAPGISFNKNGYRLGFGLGYYDRYLKDKEKIKIGVCYSEEITDIHFEDEWDVKFNYIVSEEKIIKVDEENV